MSVAITAQAPGSPPLRQRPLHRKRAKALARPPSRGSSTFSPRPAWTPATDRRAQGDQFRSFERGDAREVARVHRARRTSLMREPGHESQAEGSRRRGQEPSLPPSILLAPLGNLSSLSQFSSHRPVWLGRSACLPQSVSLPRRSASRTGVGTAGASASGLGDHRPRVGHGPR